MGKQGNHTDLAAELLRSLFSGRGGQKQKKQHDEWSCQKCGTSNFVTRTVCRRCKCPVQTTVPKAKVAVPQHVVKAPSTKPAALAPWASRDMIEARGATLSALLEKTKACGGCDTAVASLEAELEEIHRKRTADPPSIHKRIDVTRGFIERAEKRHQNILDEMEVLKTRERAVFKEVEEAKVRLKQMEEEARESLSGPSPAQISTTGSSSVDSLLQNCATLLQAIESAAAFSNGSSTNLPPNVLEAMRTMHSNVAQLRPLPSPTKDGPLEPAEIPVVVVIDNDSLMEEMDDDDMTDDKLLEIAKRLRAKRLRSS